MEWQRVCRLWTSRTTSSSPFRSGQWLRGGLVQTSTCPAFMFRPGSSPTCGFTPTGQPKLHLRTGVVRILERSSGSRNTDCAFYASCRTSTTLGEHGELLRDRITTTFSTSRSSSLRGKDPQSDLETGRGHWPGERGWLRGPTSGCHCFAALRSGMAIIPSRCTSSIDRFPLRSVWRTLCQGHVELASWTSNFTKSGGRTLHFPGDRISLGPVASGSFTTTGSYKAEKVATLYNYAWTSYFSCGASSYQALFRSDFWFDPSEIGSDLFIGLRGFYSPERHPFGRWDRDGQTCVAVTGHIYQSTTHPDGEWSVTACFFVVHRHFH